MTALIAAGILAAAVLGWTVSLGPKELENAFFGFGALALSYLVLEELLSEAHEQEGGAKFAAMIWVGFLPLFVGGMLLK